MRRGQRASELLALFVQFFLVVLIDVVVAPRTAQFGVFCLNLIHGDRDRAGWAGESDQWHRATPNRIIDLAAAPEKQRPGSPVHQVGCQAVIQPKGDSGYRPCWTHFSDEVKRLDQPDGPKSKHGRGTPTDNRQKRVEEHQLVIWISRGRAEAKLFHEFSEPNI